MDLFRGAERAVTKFCHGERPRLAEEDRKAATGHASLDEKQGLQRRTSSPTQPVRKGVVCRPSARLKKEKLPGKQAGFLSSVG